jgi:hypothetical protein
VVPAAVVTVAAVIAPAIPVVVPATLAMIVPVVVPGAMVVTRRHPDRRRGVADTGRCIYHIGGRRIPGTGRMVDHHAPVVIVGCDDAHHGADETPDDGTFVAADHVTEHRPGTGTEQRTGQFVRSRGGVVSDAGQTGCQDYRGYKFAFHDALLGLTPIPY